MEKEKRRETGAEEERTRQRTSRVDAEVGIGKGTTTGKGMETEMTSMEGMVRGTVRKFRRQKMDGPVL